MGLIIAKVESGLVGGLRVCSDMRDLEERIPMLEKAGTGNTGRGGKHAEDGRRLLASKFSAQFLVNQLLCVVKLSLLGTWKERAELRD